MNKMENLKYLGCLKEEITEKIIKCREFVPISEGHAEEMGSVKEGKSAAV